MEDEANEFWVEEGEKEEDEVLSVRGPGLRFFQAVAFLLFHLL